MSTHDASWGFMMHHEYSRCIMRAHDASCVLMMHHEYSWCSMSAHDAMMHHEYSWFIMMHHDYSWCILNTIRYTRTSRVPWQKSQEHPGYPGSTTYDLLPVRNHISYLFTQGLLLHKDGAQNKKAWGPKKAKRKKPFCRTMLILGGCPGSRIYLFVVHVLEKSIGFIAPEMVPWLSTTKIRGPTWRPEDQFGGVWWWSDFPIFPKNMKIDFPHAM